MGILKLLFRFRAVPIVLSVLGGMCISHADAQVRPLEFRNLQDSLVIEPRPVLLLITTDWCVYCRMQKFHIHKNKQFAKNRSHFYYAELDAEDRDPIQFKGRSYRYLPGSESSGVHELAVALGRHNGSLSYPTWVVLDRDLRVIYRHSGVLNRKELALMTESLIKWDQEK